ncbi:MAG: hypothetical protein IVW54_14050 [Candidatus Binataceae bacterium]|nr:hypothetical protein [Candidatus Binataceae bacterium]
MRGQPKKLSWRYAAGVSLICAGVLMAAGANSYAAMSSKKTPTPHLTLRNFTMAGTAIEAVETCPTVVTDNAGTSTPICLGFTGSAHATGIGQGMSTISAGDLFLGREIDTDSSGGFCDLANGDMTITNHNNTMTLDYIGIDCDAGNAVANLQTGPSIVNASFFVVSGKLGNTVFSGNSGVGGGGSAGGQLTITNDGADNLLIVLNGTLEVSP